MTRAITVMLAMAASVCSMPALSGGAHAQGQAAPPRTPPTVEDVRRLHADPKAYIASLDNPERDLWQKPREVMAALGLTGGEQVADIGAGSGYFALRFARHVGPSGRVYAVDISPDMIRHLGEQARKAALDNVQAVLAPADDPRLPAGAIDLVFICNTWHHIADHPTYLAALRAALKPAGRLVVIDWQKDDLRAGPPPEMRVARDAVVAEFERAGFRLGGEPRLLPHQYFLIFWPLPPPTGG